MAFNTKVDVADTELEADETVTAEAEDGQTQVTFAGVEIL